VNRSYEGSSWELLCSNQETWEGLAGYIDTAETHDYEDSSGLKLRRNLQACPVLSEEGRLIWVEVAAALPLSFQGPEQGMHQEQLNHFQQAKIFPITHVNAFTPPHTTPHSNKNLAISGPISLHITAYSFEIPTLDYLKVHNYGEQRNSYFQACACW